MLQWTLGCMYPVELVFSFTSDKYPDVQFLDHMVVLVLIFWGNSTLFLSGCTNLHFHQQYTSVPFSPHPYQHLLSFVFLMITILTGMSDISLWFLFAFFSWLVMLRFFSCACWPSVWLLWKITIQIFFFFFFTFIIIQLCIDLKMCLNF